MVQVVYDYGYDRNYEDAERIFRVENKFMSRVGYSTVLSRPMIEAMKSASPEIEARGRRLLQLYEGVECSCDTFR